jgi:hypothetical protein
MIAPEFGEKYKDQPKHNYREKQIGNSDKAPRGFERTAEFAHSVTDLPVAAPTHPTAAIVDALALTIHTTEPCEVIPPGTTGNQ